VKVPDVISRYFDAPRTRYRGDCGAVCRRRDVRDEGSPVTARTLGGVFGGGGGVVLDPRLAKRRRPPPSYTTELSHRVRGEEALPKVDGGTQGNFQGGTADLKWGLHDRRRLIKQTRHRHHERHQRSERTSRGYARSAEGFRENLPPYKDMNRMPRVSGSSLPSTGDRRHRACVDGPWHSDRAPETVARRSERTARTLRKKAFQLHGDSRRPGPKPISATGNRPTTARQ